MQLTIAEIKEVRNRLHCSLRKATNVAKKAYMLNNLAAVCKRGKMSDFKALMIEVINELYKD